MITMRMQRLCYLMRRMIPTGQWMMRTARQRLRLTLAVRRDLTSLSCRNIFLWGRESMNIRSRYRRRMAGRILEKERSLDISNWFVVQLSMRIRFVFMCTVIMQCQSSIMWVFISCQKRSNKKMIRFRRDWRSSTIKTWQQALPQHRRTIVPMLGIWIVRISRASEIILKMMPPTSRSRAIRKSLLPALNSTFAEQEKSIRNIIQICWLPLTTENRFE